MIDSDAVRKMPKDVRAALGKFLSDAEKEILRLAYESRGVEVGNLFD